MIKVGLTGNIGSGKTTVSKVFETIGIPVFNADERARGLLRLNSVKESICRVFGETILDSLGEIDRKKLASMVFVDPQKLEALNRIVHPVVRQEYANWLSLHEASAYTIQEAAILFETGLYKEFDKIIVVAAPFELRLKRVMGRDNVSREKVLQRAINQLPQEHLVEKADYVILNDGKNPVLPEIREIDARLRLLQQKAR